MLKYNQWIYGDTAPAIDVFQDGPDYYGYDVSNYFGFDKRIHSAPLYAAPLPLFDKIIYEESEENIIFRKEDDGKVVKVRKDGSSMPQFLEFPVKSMSDFKKIKKRFNPNDQNRTPGNFKSKIEEYKKRDYVLNVGGTLFSGFFSVLRELMGFDTTLTKFYDDIKLIMEILDFFTDYYINLYKKVVSQVEVDCIYIWEDMCYKNGPLISPEFFRKYILPYYKRFTSVMKDYGVKNFFVDTDGNPEKLIPLFIEGGVTGLFPFEINSGVNIEKIRVQYPELVIIGGIDKTALSKGKDNIIKEINKAKRMVSIGGYIPHTDHAVPPDVSFENYKFFRKELIKIIKK